MLISISASQREAAREAIALLKAQAVGLAATGSVSTVEQINDMIAALAKLADTDSPDLAQDEKVRIELATFLLQGIRVGLDNAEFHERARHVQRIIDELADVVGDYNAKFSETITE